MQLHHDILTIKLLTMVLRPAAEAKTGTATRPTNLHEDKAARHFGLDQGRAPELITINRRRAMRLNEFPRVRGSTRRIGSDRSGCEQLACAVNGRQHDLAGARQSQ